ncbi:MAG: transglycosylase SLT domain-containing protein, partial [Gammaproteobacteria bacterium]
MRVLDRSQVVPPGPLRVETIGAVATLVSWNGSSPRRPAARDDTDESAEPTAEQRNIARFVASKYRLTVGEVQRFVEHAYQAAREFRLDPYLVLAVVSVESSFNPNARNPSGAQGLMQVLTRVHTDKFAPFGGSKAAFDPMANLAVGSQILKEYIVREGSVEAALKSYVGAALLPHDHGYGNKVLTERDRIVAAAAGKGDSASPSRATEPTKTAVATGTAASAPDQPRSADATQARSGDPAPAPSADAVQARSARIEAALAEAARAEAERAEVARAKAAEIESARIQAERAEAERSEAARIKAAQIDAALAETARAEAARLKAA